jgi:pimeloyl-ACP methyl ester carboxylesterase
LGEDALAVGRALLGDRFALAGFSMGGMAALHATLESSEAITALALVATTAGGKGLTWPSRTVIESATGLMSESDEERTRRSVVLAFSSRFTTEHPDIIDWLVAEEMAEPLSEQDWAAHARIFTTHDVANRLAEIAVPTVVICGSDDENMPVENSHYLAEHIRDARLVVLPGARHGLHIECPGALKAELLGILSSP